MVTKGGRPWFCFGVMGGDMQPQGQVQVLLNMVVFGMNPQEAGEAARLCEVGGALAVESGISMKAVEGLRAKGHRIVQSPGVFGGYQGVHMDPHSGVLYGASENRKDGCAVGY
jgi:gamma-glutamyltranspeptidase/glutathione hydrolase